MDECTLETITTIVDRLCLVFCVLLVTQLLSNIATSQMATAWAQNRWPTRYEQNHNHDHCQQKQGQGITVPKESYCDYCQGIYVCACDAEDGAESEDDVWSGRGANW